MSSQTRGRRPSMFDPIDPKELQQALYASAAAVSLKRFRKRLQMNLFSLHLSRYVSRCP